MWVSVLGERKHQDAWNHYCNSGLLLLFAVLLLGHVMLL